MNKVFASYYLIFANICVVTRRVGQKAKRYFFLFSFFWIAFLILLWLNTSWSKGIPVVNMDFMKSRDGAGTSVVDSIISTMCCLKDLDWMLTWGSSISLMIFWLRNALPSRTLRSSLDYFVCAKLSLRFFKRGEKQWVRNFFDLWIIVYNFLCIW